ncbi:uncharacterized protein LOC144101699 [Amblyomma americanum]
MTSSDELFYIVITLSGVTAIFVLYWLLLRKLRATAVKPCVVDALGREAQPKRSDVVAPPAVARPTALGQPGEKPPVAQPTVVKTVASDILLPGRRIANAARHASETVSRVFKEETTTILHALSSGADAAQVPTDASLKPELTALPNKETKAESTKAGTASNTADDTRGTEPKSCSPPSQTIPGGQKSLPASSKDSDVTTEKPVQSKDEDPRNDDMTKAQPSSLSKVDVADLTKPLTQSTSSDKGSARDEVVVPASVSDTTVAKGHPVPQQNDATAGSSSDAAGAHLDKAQDQSVPTSPEHTTSTSKRRRKKSKTRRSSSSAGIDQTPTQSEIKSDISSKRKKKSKRTTSGSPPSAPSEASGASVPSSPPREDRKQTGTAHSHPRLVRRRSSTKSRASRKSLIPEGSWSEDVSPPAGWTIQLPPVPTAMVPKVNTSSRKQSSAAASLPVRPALITLSPVVPNMDIFSQEHSPYVASPTTGAPPGESRGIVPDQPPTPMKGNMDIFSREHSPYLPSSPPSGIVEGRYSTLNQAPTPMKGNMDVFSRGQSPYMPTSPQSGLVDASGSAPVQPPTPVKGNMDIFSREHSPYLPSSPPSGLAEGRYSTLNQAPTPMKGNMDIFSRGQSPYMPTSPQSGLVDASGSAPVQPPTPMKGNMGIFSREHSLSLPSSPPSDLVEGRGSIPDQQPTSAVDNMGIFSRGHSPYMPTSPPSGLGVESPDTVLYQAPTPMKGNMDIFSREHSPYLPSSPPSGLAEGRGTVPDQPPAPMAANKNIMPQEHSPNMPSLPPSGPVAESCGSVADQPLMPPVANAGISRECSPLVPASTKNDDDLKAPPLPPAAP